MFNAEGKTSKEFKSIQLRNNSLTVDYITDADEGYYMCTANNGIGPGLKKILHINVNGKCFYFINCISVFILNKFKSKKEKENICKNLS